MIALRRAACVLLAAASLLASPVYSTSFSTDQSDLWYIPAESGWGIQLVQRGSVIFATMFVYDPNGNPVWYVATMQFAGNFTWTGDLYATTGPWFGAVPFNPANVAARKVGTMTWAAQTVETGTLSYVVDGVAVTKNVVRQALVLDDYSGTYLGALHATATGCFNPANNFSGGEVFVTAYVAQSGQSISVSFVSSATGASVTVTGILTQYGQFGSILGTYSSSSGEVGNALLFAMNTQLDSFSARFSFNSTNIGCQNTGYLGGVRSRS